MYNYICAYYFVYMFIYRCRNAFSKKKCRRRAQLMMKIRVCKYHDRAIKRRCRLSSKESRALMKACIDSGCGYMTRQRKTAVKTGCQTLDLISGICRAKGHDVNWRIYPLNDCRSKSLGMSILSHHFLCQINDESVK